MTLAIPIPTSPAYAQTDSEGRRWYIFDGDDTRYLSVSTATGVIGSEGLMIWAAGLAAKAAFIELPTIITSSRKKPCEHTYSRCRGDGPNQHDWRTTCDRCPCGICRGCVTKWVQDRHIAESTRRSNEGTRTHDYIEWWSRYGEERPYDQDIAPYVAAFKAFVAEYGLTPDDFLLSECTVINRAHRYAGTCDGIVRIHARRTQAAAELVARVLFAAGEYQQFADDRDALIAAVIADDRFVDLVFDVKTQEKVKEKANWYPDQALQVTGYRWASVIRFKDTGQEVAMPDTHGGLILQLRPDGCTPRLVVSDEVSFEAFLHAVGLCRWLLELGPKSVQVGSFPLPKKAPAPRPRKAAVKKTAPAKKAASAAPAPSNVTPIGSRRAQARAAVDPFAAHRNATTPGDLVADTDIPF